MQQEWVVGIKPIQDYDPDKQADVSGLRIIITDGSREEEVGRVAFQREFAKDPSVPFQDALKARVDQAEECCNIINDALDELDRAQAEAVMKARDRVREILNAGTEGGVMT